MQCLEMQDFVQSHFPAKSSQTTHYITTHFMIQKNEQVKDQVNARNYTSMFGISRRIRALNRSSLARFQ